MENDGRLTVSDEAKIRCEVCGHEWQFDYRKSGWVVCCPQFDHAFGFVLGEDAGDIKFEKCRFG